ncbi:MAG: single-stranded-DNA-specific exonuclease RecJ [Bdellovibrionales bacterium]|nr:single-stranded-DNA-specific exonuclease RecJ [Bdellovibrionales bacterium]
MQKSNWTPRRAGEAPASLRARYGRMLSQLLWSRGWDEDASHESRFEARLDTLTSPFKLKNMDAAADRVARAIQSGEAIAIYADYDIDGMSGLAILVSFFEACGATKVVAYQPDRLHEGYGVHPDAIRKLYDDGARVVITVDTGIAAFDAALEAQRIGLDFIVTDHHQQIGEVPAGATVVNPNQRGDDSELGYLSGAGVAFYLAMAVRARLRDAQHFTSERPQPDIKNWLDLFVLGTIADHVDLAGDNRALVRAGLKQLEVTQRPGLKLLRQRTLPRSSALSARDVAFSLTPKLNAASRMGQAALSTELLLTTSETRAAELVDAIMELNAQRSAIQAQIFDEAIAQVGENPDMPVIVARGEWHEGVLGIVAAKLVDRYRRPAIVLTQLPHDPNFLRGSMRTITEVSCIAALNACRDLLTRYGGHEMAAGLLLEVSKFESFLTALQDSPAKLAGESLGKNEIAFDGELPWEDLLPERIQALDGLGPWGAGNPEPLFLVEGIDLSSLRILKQQHVKIELPQGTEMIGFFKANEIEAFRKAGHQKIDALLKPETNRFRGTETVQLKLEYVRPHQNQDSGTGS